MGQQARDGRGVRQERETTSRRIRSDERQAHTAGRSSKARRAARSATEEDLVRGFVLQGFDRATDELRVELHLRPVPLEKLRSLFDARDDPEMSDAYPLDTAKARVLAPLVSEPIDIERYDFFLQRYA